MAKRSWQTTKQLVYTRAAGCCEYCQTCEINIGQAMHVEHIDPKGSDHPDNLCLSCPNCNLSKASATVVLDLDTGQQVPLFDPRQQKWEEHFEWAENYSQIRGLTPVGRATVTRLKMNRPRIVLARQRWVQAGFHPVTKVDEENIYRP
jgi:hypothetical protein